MDLDEVITELSGWINTSPDGTFKLELITIPAEYDVGTTGLALRGATMQTKNFQDITRLCKDVTLANVKTNVSLVHNQGNTNFCWIFAIISVMRSELRRVLRLLLAERHGKDTPKYHAEVTALLEKGGLMDTEYTHQDMMISFLFCAYPRAMDGLNNDAGAINFDTQVGFIKKATMRLVTETLFHGPGWHMIPSLSRLLEDYGFARDEFNLLNRTVMHPAIAGINEQERTFDHILTKPSKQTIICNIYFDYDAANPAKFRKGHTIQMIGLDAATACYEFKDTAGSDQTLNLPKSRETHGQIMKGNKAPEDIRPGVYSNEDTEFIFDHGYTLSFVKCNV